MFVEIIERLASGNLSTVAAAVNSTNFMSLWKCIKQDISYKYEPM
jgi:hypothetical protein